MHILGHGVPTVLFSLTSIFTSAVSNNFSDALSFGIYAGLLAMISASATSIGLNASRILRKKGQLAGGKIVRRAQAGVYATVIGTSLAFSASSNNSTEINSSKISNFDALKIQELSP